MNPIGNDVHIDPIEVKSVDGKTTYNLERAVLNDGKPADVSEKEPTVKGVPFDHVQFKNNNTATKLLIALGAFKMPAWMFKVPPTEEELQAKKLEEAKPRWTENGQREINRRLKQIKKGMIHVSPTN